MKTIWKKIVLCLVVFVGLSITSVGWTANSPLRFKNDFADRLIQGMKGESAFDLGVDQENSFIENIREVFYPSADAGNRLWRIIRIITVGILVLLLVWAGLRFVLWPNDEAELKKSQMNLLYILLGVALIFMSTWLLGALDLGSVQGLTGEDSLVERTESRILLVVLGFLKAAAFFLAIVFLAYYGYRMMQAFDKEDKQKAARRGILNVLVALLFIKIIDYLYFIAQQEEFHNFSINLVVGVSRYIAYIAGMIFVVALIYAGYLYLTASGSDDQIKKASNIIKTVFVVVLLILLFLLVIYQVVKDIVT